MDVQVEWDEEKARANVKKHAITFAEAATVFLDPFLLTFPDDLHSDIEERFISIGQSDRQRLILVVHTDRGTAIRIISARKPTAKERITYEQ
ncbi:MAG: BrnT family toxin [Oscillochloridaceae bacterium umkhey_bin13]